MKQQTKLSEEQQQQHRSLSSRRKDSPRANLRMPKRCCATTRRTPPCRRALPNDSKNPPGNRPRRRRVHGGEICSADNSMKHLWHRFLASLTPGVRILLCLLSAVYLAAVIGKFSHAYDLYRWLAVSGPNFWHGQVWELITYPLLPTTVFDFVFNSLMIVLLGGLLERIWSRAEFWTYCAVAAVGAGLAKVILQFSNPFPMTGMAPVVFGLLAAWGYPFRTRKSSVGVFRGNDRVATGFAGRGDQFCHNVVFHRAGQRDHHAGRRIDGIALSVAAFENTHDA